MWHGGGVRLETTTVASVRSAGSSALRWAAPALLGYAAVRAVGVLTLVLWSPGPRPGPGGGTGGGLSRLATFWDAFWYRSLAVHGYAGTPPVPGPHGLYQPYAFFPAYPLLVRAVPGLPVGAAVLLVTWAASLAAAWGIFAIAARLYGRRAGVIAAVLWGVLPYAVVESAAYSEALFTALAAWSVYAAIRRWWVWSGALSLLAGLTRPTGVALAGAVCCAALWEFARCRGGRRALLGCALAPLGFLGYVAWVGLRLHRWDGYFRVQDAWESHVDFGRSTFYAFKRLLMAGGPVWLTDAVVALVLVAAVVLFALSLLQRQPPVLLLYSAAMLALALGDAAYFNSRARFLLPAFGLLLPLAAGLARIRSRAALYLLLGSAAVVSAAYGGYVVFVYPDAP
ncbi:glycosyltransferase family 39 protein [Kitasatospora cinereorecta]